MKSFIFQNNLKVVAISLMVLAWALPWLMSLDTFDLDEALYREVAREMKISSEFFTPKWDRRDFYEKPVWFYWLLVGSSHWHGDGPSEIGARASRAVSLLVFAVLALLWVRFLRGVSGSIPILLMGNIPLLGIAASSVLIDPLLVLTFFPAFWVGQRICDEKIKWVDVWWLGISMGLATCAKGLVGFVLPIGALGFHWLLGFLLARFSQGRNQGHKVPFFRSLMSLVLQLMGALLVALSLSGLYYWKIYEHAGMDFFREFIGVHHFGRAASAMEDHSGPFLYHFIVLWVGGVFFSFWALSFLYLHGKELLSSYSRRGWGISWTLFVLIFFGLVSTKLLFYSLPAWLGLILFFSESLGSEGLTQFKPLKSWKRWSAVFFLPSVVLLVLFLFLAVFPEGLRWFADGDPRSEAVIQSLMGDKNSTWTFFSSAFPSAFRWGFLSAAVSLVGLLITGWNWMKTYHNSQAQDPAKGAMFVRDSSLQALTWGCLFTSLLLISLFMGPVLFVQDLMVGPWKRLARTINEKKSDGVCLMARGQRGPSVSLNAPSWTINECMSHQKRWILTATWDKESCAPPAKVMGKDMYVIWCEE